MKFFVFIYQKFIKNYISYRFNFISNFYLQSIVRNANF